MARPEGVLRVKRREVRPPPKRGKQVYILTCAQNNTKLFTDCWDNLQALAAHDGAEILVSRFTYATNSRASVGQKVTARKTARESDEPLEWWDDRIEPHTSDRSIEIAPGLVWCGELQILPTAVNPLSGLQSYTARASSIVPHVTHAVESVASPKREGTKFLYTTGTVTLRNYIQKKSGQKAAFHHSYGAVLVEVCPDGTWFVRQLNADSEGVIYDLDRRVAGGRVTYGHRPEALVWGDIHVRQLESHMRELGWGPGGILDSLRPRRQVMHDVLDFRSQNHHDRSNPWLTYAKHLAGGLDVSAEIDELGAFLKQAARPWCETVIVAANHDEALMRWLREADFRQDPINAEFMLQASLATYQAVKRGDKKFYPLRWAVESRCGRVRGARWLRRDETYVVCHDRNGGISLDMHGDKGSNGAKGSLVGFARSGRKCIVADRHACGLYQGAMQVGVMGSLDQGYNEGQSSWSHTNAIVYGNAKRSLFTIYNRRWRA